MSARHFPLTDGAWLVQDSFPDLNEIFQPTTALRCRYPMSTIGCRLNIRSMLVLVAGLMLFGSIRCATAADELLPPFGFRWNDSMPRVEAVLNGAKAKIVAREK
jgi:hypothetical protein